MASLHLRFEAARVAKLPSITRFVSSGNPELSHWHFKLSGKLRMMLQNCQTLFTHFFSSSTTPLKFEKNFSGWMNEGNSTCDQPNTNSSVVEVKRSSNATPTSCSSSTFKLNVLSFIKLTLTFEAEADRSLATGDLGAWNLRELFSFFEWRRAGLTLFLATF